MWLSDTLKTVSIAALVVEKLDLLMHNIENIHYPMLGHWYHPMLSSNKHPGYHPHAGAILYIY